MSLEVNKMKEPVSSEEEAKKLEPRMRNPGVVLPAMIKPVQDLYAVAFSGGVSPKTLALVHLRVSQINGCSFCVVSGSKEAMERGEKPERIAATASWRDAPFFTESERAALRLAEAVTRISDRPEAVTDEIWAEATKYYDEKAMSALLIGIAVTNVFNRMNVPTRTLATIGQPVWSGDGS